MSSRSRSERELLDPVVSVVMSVYNGLPYLEEAVQSILDQTFEDFEFIIINDGSLDGSKAVLEKFADSDDRIRLVNQENRGLPASLNRGIHMARGKYIARMDADDVSQPNRFEQQVDFLNIHPEIGIVGTQIEIINADGETTASWSLPTERAVIAWQLQFQCCLNHPSIMMRRTLVENLGGYVGWATCGQDYELYTRALLRTGIVNLQSTLLKARRWAGSTTATRREKQIRMYGKAASTLHEEILGKPVDPSIVLFLVWVQENSIERAAEKADIEDLAQIHDYLINLYSMFVRRFLLDGPNINVRQRALFQMDRIADSIADNEGLTAGTLHKLKSRCMVPREIGPWMLEALQRRIS